MKTRKLLPLALSFTLLASCGASAAEDPWQRLARQEGRSFDCEVTATFYPLYDFANKILGNLYEGGEFTSDYLGSVLNFVGEGEAHDFDPSDPQKLVRAQDSLAVFSLMPAFDRWAAELGDKDTPVVNVAVAAGITDLDGNTIGEGSDRFDPHVWLSPKRAIKMVEAMTDTLVSIFEEKSFSGIETLKNNSAKFIEDLNSLDREYSQSLSSFAGETVVTSHECFSYLCQDYGLIQYGIADFANNEPDPQSLSQMEDFLWDNDIDAIYLESLDSTAAVDTVIEDLRLRGRKIEKRVLWSLESLPESMIDAGEDYLSVMRLNLDTLVNTL